MSGTTPELTFGRFLKFWRKVHSINQEELAHRLSSSTRHISRLENGLSRPSENIIEEISKALSLGERDRNHLRISAGYSPVQDKVDFHAPELKWLRKAMMLTLRAMDPFPATLMDSTGNILMVNRAWVGFYQNILSKESLNNVNNHFEFLFSSQNAASILSGWKDTIAMILMALKQAAMLSNDPLKMALLDRFLNHPNVPEDWMLRASKLEPMASFRVQVELSGRSEIFYSVSQTVGALGPVAYVSEPQLTISTLYPEDDNLDLLSLIDGKLKHPLLCY